MAKVTMIVLSQAHNFEVTAEGSGPVDAMDKARRMAEFEITRRPGCTCEAAATEADRCDGITLRCNGAILGSRQTNSTIPYRKIVATTFSDIVGEP